MLPVYRYMDSYPQPHQRNHSPYPHHYYPMDPFETPAAYEPWPHGGSYGYPSPVQCHGCFNNHSCPPGYFSFRPPHPPTHHPLCYHSPYPPYHEAYPAYSFPPPHYSMEQPKYDYDKSIHGNHCCGCLNNSRNHKKDKELKIEEQEPEVEKKENDSSVNNYPYPIMWFPPEYTKNKESNKPSELEPKVCNGWSPIDTKNDKDTSNTSKLDSKACDSWFPLDMNSIRSLKQGGNGEGDKAQFPYPLFWIPSYEMQGEAEKKDVKETNTSPKVAEEAPANIKFIPLKLFGNGDHEDKSGVVEDSSRSMMHPKMEEQEVKPKDIHVKQMEETEAKKSSEDTERKFKIIPVKQLKEENREKSSSSDKNAERRSPSSRKTSKLPPVCLRVDPLPRPKSTSRSPSPPGLKSKVQQSSDGTPKAPDLPAQEPIENKNGEVPPRKENKVEVEETRKDEKMKEDKIEQVSVPIVSNEEVKAELCERECTTKEDGGATEEKTEEKRKGKKDLSTTEAAVIIQSAYRGFEVRKWEPLKKLRQIARIHKQVDEVKERIHELESSVELQKDEKQKILIGETIMGLLLQLDTIQGLHPSVREIRKSVARELMCLQEKLDYFTGPNAEGLKPTEPDEVGVEDLHETANDIGYMPTEQPKEEKHAKNFEESSSDGCTQMAEIRNDTKESEQMLNDTKESEQMLLETSNSDAKEQLLTDKVAVDTVKESIESSIVSEKEAVSSKADGLQVEELSVVVDEETDSKMEEELTGSPIEDRVHHELKLEAKSILAEPEANNLLAEPTLASSVEENVELNIEKIEDSISQENIADSKPENLLLMMMPQGVEESEEKKSHMEEPIESEGIALEAKEDVKMTIENKDDNIRSPSLAVESEGITLEAKEDVKMIIENKDDNVTSPSLAVNETMAGEIEEGSFPPMALEAVDISVELPHNEEEAEAEAAKDSEATMVYLSTPRFVEQVVMDSAPGSELSEEIGDSYSVAKETQEDKKLVEENEKLREMLEKLIEAGKQQLTVISDLSGRVKDLEGKLSRKKKLKPRMRRQRSATTGSLQVTSEQAVM